MDTYTFLLPVYNDWESTKILLNQIEKYLKNIKNNYKVLIINDNSSEKIEYNFNKKKFFKEIKILNLNKNIGSQKSIATGLKYISKNHKNNNEKFIIMDSDGEDDPKKIKEIIKLVEKNKKLQIITMNRTIRKESLFFSILYEIHLIITFLITFNYIRFGNFSFLKKKIVDKITKKNELWLAYSATLKKYFLNRSSILAPRRKRISGKSKMSYLGLIYHSINIQSVFKKNILIYYLLYSFILFALYFFQFLGIISITLILFLFIHYLIISFGLQKKVNGITFNICLNNIKSIKKFK